jgi:hypothetical protein
VHTLLGSFLPSAPTPTFFSLPLRSRQNLFCTFLQFRWKVEINNNKKDIAFLLVEIRTAIQRVPSIAFMYKCVTTQVNSSLTDLYTGSWSPPHVDLCHFKVSVLVPLQWGHQMLSCFGFSTFSHISRMCSPPCHVTQVQPHCCICPRSKAHIWGRTYDLWSSEPG